MGILQIFRLEFPKFRILEILNPWIIATVAALVDVDSLIVIEFIRKCLILPFVEKKRQN